MILIYPYEKLTKDFKQHKSKPKAKIEFICDKCGKKQKINYDVFEKRKKLLKEHKNIDLDLCGKCSRSYMNSINGLKGTYDSNGNLKPNSGRFSSERVKNMSKEEYKVFCEQRRQASLSFHKKLNENPKLKEEHYKKIFQNSQIGYISKGQRFLYEMLKDEGFELEKQVEGFACDIVNFDKKIIIEFYGDLFHANPKFFKPDDYIDIIKMTAKEKWKKDRARNFKLRKLGYQVIVIWEYELNNEKDKLLNKLKKLKDSNWDLEKWWEFSDTKTKWVYKDFEKKNIQILNKDIQKYLDEGYCLGKNDDYKDVKLKRCWIHKNDVCKNTFLQEFNENYSRHGWKRGRIIKGEKYENNKN